MKKTVLTLALSLALSSCGGGGGNKNKPPEIKVEKSSQYSSVAIDDSLRLTSQSSDPDGDSLTHSWQVTEQPESSHLSGSNDDYYDFMPAVPGDYRIRLTLSDGEEEVYQTFAYHADRSLAIIKPDLNSALSAVEQVEAVFGAGSVDLPETHDAEHLSIVDDPKIGAAWEFSSHLDMDGDRQLPLSETDRQRTEIKIFANSSDDLLCKKGQTKRLSWSFKVENLDLSTSFTHFFQIKGSSDHPLLTLTAKRTNGVEALRVNYGEQDEVLGDIDWQQVNNIWLDVELTFNCSDQGGLKLKLLNHDTKETLIEIDKPELDMWQSDADDGLGLKWGIYRKVKANIGDSEFKSGLTSLESRMRMGNLLIGSD